MNVVIILSGGVGTRMGLSHPKQYLIVKEKPIILYSIEKFIRRPDIDALVIVIADEWKEFLLRYLDLYIKLPIFWANPGETRQHSIYNGLKVIYRQWQCHEDDIVIIHDAVRPLVTDAIIDQCIEGCKYYDGVLPVVKLKDTIYLSHDEKSISALLNRAELFAGQAPESFVLDKYLTIHNKLSNEEIAAINGSTEIAYKYGLNIRLVPGDEINFKITTPEDLILFEQFV